MITILSPAKTLDFDAALPEMAFSQPDFVDESTQLIGKLKTLSKKKVSALMNLNKDLTELNVMRYQEWEPNFDNEASRPAILTFSGEVYRGLGAKEMSHDDLMFSQEHVRILSGLHGLLRPLDRIRPYRLEMGTSLPVRRKKNLYEFWKDKVTKSLNDALDSTGTEVLVNLASNEYSKAIDMRRVKGRVITPVFKDGKNGEYKVVMTWAKHARGAMTRFIIQNRITNPEDLKAFELYTYSPKLSNEDDWVFVRH
ncbi:MAG: peroxide stress protein YaaA [Flavobacteriales bacterium]|nr:peroxide stress protein YaaA [Flavobacteriales bacterium]